MELMFVVYMVDLLNTIKQAAGVILGGLVTLALVSLIGFVDKVRKEDKEVYTIWWKKNMLWHKTAAILLAMCVFVPSTDAIKYMGAAYLIQTTYESGFVQEAGGLAGKAVTNQLRKWAEANPDIDGLLESVGETKGKLETVIPASDE
jgi:hypothetical protein